jgi:CRP-like cAMP-binding protein
MSSQLRKHIEKITSLTDEEFEFVFSHFHSKKLRKHQYLIEAGEYVENSYWVVSGFLKAYYVDASEKEHTLSFAMEDWWITDYEAYITRTMSRIFVDSIEASEVLYISLDDREKLCNELHKMANFFREKVDMGYVGLQNRILTLLTTNAKERYDELLLKNPELFQRASKTLIASYLGVSRETLSRLNG